MFYITLILIYFVIYGILILTGLGLASIFCRGRTAHYALLLSPIIGIVVLCILPLYFSVLGVNTFWSSRIGFLVFFMLSLFRIVTKPLKIDLTITLVLAGSIIIAIIPACFILIKTGYLTTTFQSYSLFVTAPAEYFINHTFKATPTIDYLKPISNLLYEVVHNKEYFGFFFLLSSISSLTGISTFQIYLLLSSVATSFIPMSIFVACKEGFAFSNKLALLSAFLCSINYSYYMWHIYGQLPMVLGLTFLILCFGFIPMLLDSDNKRELILFSLFIVGCLSNYWIITPYFFLSCLLFVLINVIVSPRTILPINNLVQVAFLVVILNPFSFIFLALRGYEILRITSQFTENIPRYPRIEELFGLVQHFAVNQNISLSVGVAFLVGLIAFCIVSFGLYKCFKDDNRLLLSIILIIAILCGYFWVTGLKYHFYKNLIIGTFPLIVLMAIGLDWFFHYRANRYLYACFILYLSVFISLNVFTYLQFISHDHRVIEESLFNLEESTRNIPIQGNILVDSDIPTEEAWIAYFMRDRNLKLKGAVEPWGFWILAPFSGKPNKKFFFNPTHDSIEYTLTSCRTREADISPSESCQPASINQTYHFYKGLPNPYIFRGYYHLEKHGNGKFRWTGRESQLLINKPTEDIVLEISGAIPPFHEGPLAIEFFLNDMLVERCQLSFGLFSKRWVLKKETLTREYNVFAMNLDRTFCPGLVMNSTEMRDLGLQVSAISLLPGNSLLIRGPIDIGSLEDDPHLLRNWSFNEVMGDLTTYKWVEGTDASLAIFLEKPQNMRMEFRALPLLCTSCSHQKISVFVNGKQLESITLSHNYWEVHSIDIPSELLLNGLNSIEFRFSFSASPSRLFENNSDQRVLSVAFDYVQFSAI